MTGPPAPKRFPPAPNVTTVEEFLELLRTLLSKSGRTAGKVATYAKLPRSTAYRFVSTNNHSLPKERQQVKAFLDGCGVSEADRELVLASWDYLNQLEEESSNADASAVVGREVHDAEVVDLGSRDLIRREVHDVALARDDISVLVHRWITEDDETAARYELLKALGNSGMVAGHDLVMAHGAADAKIDALATELKLLRKGLGIQAKNLPGVLGAQLREVCGIRADDSPGTVRGKVVATLGSLIKKLPGSHRDTAQIVLGFGNGANLRYTARLELLGTGADRNIRTLQRRADDVVHLIAEAAYATPPAFGAADVSRDGPWHTSSLAVRLTLSGAGAEVFETRRIVSHVAGLSEIEHAISLARPASPTARPDLSGLGIDVVAGGEVHSVRMVSATRVAFRLRPTRPLDAGDEHEFFFRIRLEELPAPFYCCTPEFPCESFDLNVRFDRREPPTRIWRIDGDFSKDAEDPTPARKPLFLDNAGEVHTGFTDLRPARSYGVGWQPTSSTPGTAAGIGHTH